MSISVFDFSDAVAFLRANFEEKRGRNPRFSLRAWTRSLGIQNTASVSRILIGERFLGYRLAKKIADGLELGPDERKYFLFLASARVDGIDLPFIRSVLERTNHRAFDEMTPDQFHFISEWHHVAILEMTALTGFQADPNWISERLGRKISPGLCREALSRLSRLGLISLSRSGKKVKRQRTDTLRIHSPIRSVVLREYHRQGLDRAVDSLDSQDADTRTLGTTTIAIKKTDLHKARELVLKVHERLTSLAQDAGSDEVYQLSTQFFRITQPENVP